MNRYIQTGFLLRLLADMQADFCKKYFIFKDLRQKRIQGWAYVHKCAGIKTLKLQKCTTVYYGT